VGLRRIAIGILLSCLVAACGVVVPQTPGPEALGVPPTIGTLTVTVTTPDPQSEAGRMLAEANSAFFEAAGGTDRTSVWASFRLSDASDHLSVMGYRVIGASSGAMLAGAESMGMTLGTQAPGIAGWDLWRHDK